jgi:DNA polymerase elongation subunit (family B)
MNILVYDIETMQELFLVGVYDPVKEEYLEFEVSKNKNELDSFVSWAQSTDCYWVGYNNLRFDAQVIEWILRNYQDWHELTALETVAKIAQKAADVIHDANYEVFPEYREEWLTLKQIDLFKINHYDNKNRMVSLKRLEFEMDLENIEEMPIHHSKTNLTDEEIQLTKDYCKNDVMATYEFYKVTTGDTEHPLYKGNNQIELRQDIQEEFGIPCLNYSDSKIGDEMIKKYYCQEKRIQYSELPKKGLFRTEVKVRNCIADYVTFQTPELQEFLNKIKKEVLTMKDEFKESLEFYGNTYTFAKGGLHTENKPKVFEADDDTLIIDWDVSSYYPAIIINNGKYPGHLGSEFLRGYKTMFDKRLELKPLAKKDKKIKGIVGALKLAVNSVYGC